MHISELMSELQDLTTESLKLSKEYHDCKIALGKANTDLRILLVANMKTILLEKKNAGVEMSEIMLMQNNTVAQKLYEEREAHLHKCKGLKKIIEAIQSKISTHQSIMKYIRENGG